MSKWVCALSADCLARQNNKAKPKHPNEVPLENCQGDAAPFCAILINHKYLLIVDNFSRFLLVYPVNNTGAEATIAVVKNAYFFLEFPSLQYTMKEQRFLRQSWSTGPKIWELPFDHEQFVHLGRTVK